MNPDQKQTILETIDHLETELRDFALTLSFLRTALHASGLENTPLETPPSATVALQAVAKATGVNVAQLQSARIDRAVSEPRHLAAYLLYECLGLTLQQTAHSLQRRDRNTALNSIKRARELIEIDPQFRALAEKLRVELTPFTRKEAA